MLSLVAISFMVLGAIIFTVTLFIICGKRKLYQRKECNRKGAHVPGQEASKELKREIERRISRVSEITYEPQLINFDAKGQRSADFPSHYFRMKALDNMKYLELELKKLSAPVRNSRETARAYLINLMTPGNILCNLDQRSVHELCDQLEHARHHPAPYTAENFSNFHGLLLKVLNSARSQRKDQGLTTRPFISSERDSAIEESENSADEDNLLMPNFTNFSHNKPRTIIVNEDCGDMQL